VILKRLFSHFDDVEDVYGLVETFLAWGYEYYAPLKKWASAKECYERAGQYIAEKPEVFYEAKVRLLLARGQLALEGNDFDQAMSVLAAAKEQALEKSLVWWLSPIPFIKDVYWQLNRILHRRKGSICAF
jgi:tetratricopeptide (TPR) repeat protein